MYTHTHTHTHTHTKYLLERVGSQALAESLSNGLLSHSHQTRFLLILLKRRTTTNKGPELTACVTLESSQNISMYVLLDFIYMYIYIYIYISSLHTHTYIHTYIHTRVYNIQTYIHFTQAHARAHTHSHTHVTLWLMSGTHSQTFT